MTYTSFFCLNVLYVVPFALQLVDLVNEETRNHHNILINYAAVAVLRRLSHTDAAHNAFKDQLYAPLSVLYDGEKGTAVWGYVGHQTICYNTVGPVVCHFDDVRICLYCSVNFNIITNIMNNILE